MLGGSTGETFEPPNHTEGGENGNLLFVGSCTQQGVGSVATIREHLGASPWPSRKPEQCPVPKDSLVRVGTLLAPLDLLLPPSGAREPAHPGSPHAGGAAVRAAGHHPVHGLVGAGELRGGGAGQHPLHPLPGLVCELPCWDGRRGITQLSLLDCLVPFFFFFLLLLVGHAEWPRYVQLPNCEASPCC